MPPTSTAPPRLRLIGGLSLGLVAVSSGAILVRFSSEAPSLSIAFYRMMWASALLLPAYLVERLSGRGRWSPLHLWSGLALALHFAAWIASLRYTSVAVSVLLVNTSPVLVAAVGHVVFRERLRLRGVGGIALSLGGGALLTHADLERLGDWRGAFLALAGAAALGIYLLLGRRLRAHCTLVEYVYPTYAIAFLALGAAVWLTGSELAGFSGSTYWFLFLLGLLPQTIGHSSYNWALRFLPATTVSTLILAEPVLATLLAWWLLSEPLTLPLLVGGVLVGSGIFLVGTGGIAKPPAESPELGGAETKGC